MKYLKLYENYKVDKGDYPKDGYFLSSREETVLKDLVGDYYLKFNIKKDDGYYYTYTSDGHNRFDSFNDLKDYIQFKYFLFNNYRNKFLELVKTTNLDPSFDDNWVIRWASYYRHVEVVKILLEDPRVDPSALNNYAIRVSSEKGHLEIFKLLLKDPRVDPSAQNNEAIIVASQFRHIEIVKLLLADPRVDPSDQGNMAIRWASIKGHIEVVKLLLKDSRVISKLSPEQVNKYRNEIS